MSEEARMRERICLTGRSLYARGYAHSTAGNISVRIGDKFLITPTEACLGELEPDELALVESNGEQVSGLKASKTLRLHRAIYQSNPALRCVIHNHSTHLVALTLRGVWHPSCVLPPLTPYMVMKVGEIPLIPYDVPGAPEVALMIQAALKARPHLRGALLERLGPVVWSDNLQAASAVIEELEETAKLWLLAGTETRPLDSAQVAVLCERFGVKWSQLSAK